MPSIDCSCCGAALAVPEALREGARFACAHCGLVLRNTDGARAFRWAQLDPYVRKNGASRASVRLGLLGAVLWLPALALVLGLRGEIDLLLLLALGAPYLLMLAALRQLRPRTPPALWFFYLLASLGVYLLFTRALLTLVPSWATLLLRDAEPSILLSTLAVLGGLWAAIGAVGALLYRSRARRLPQAFGTPAARR